MPLFEAIPVLVEAQCHLSLILVCLDLSLLLAIHKVAILAVQFCCGRMEDSKMLTNIDAHHGIFNIGV